MGNGLCDERVQTPVRVIWEAWEQDGFSPEGATATLQQRLDTGITELTDACSPGTRGWEERNVRVGVCGWDNPAGRRQCRERRQRRGEW